MGGLGTRAVAAAAKNLKMHAEAMPIPTMETLKTGRMHTTCKECLPFILTTGTMVEYLENRKNKDEITLFVMPHGSGPCRQGQYYVFQEELIKKLKIKNAAVLTLYDEKSYNEFGTKFLLILWMSIISSEVMDDILRVINVLAVNKKDAREIFNREFDKILDSLKTGNISGIFSQIKSSAHELSKIELTKPLEEAKFITLTGEVFVRREEFSRLNLIETLEKNDFIVLPTPASEYFYYCNYLAKTSDARRKLTLADKLKARFTDKIQTEIERRIKNHFKNSGLMNAHMTDVKKTIMHSRHLIPEEMLGEAILTIGLSLREIVDRTCGVISIGPFGCMPSRVAESILNKEMNKTGKEKASGNKLDMDIDDLPFLAIETDGNIFPQVIQSRIEIFMLQANRLHEKMLAQKKLQNK